MGVQFTIEGEDAYTLAAELAALTGQPIAEVVTAALREQLERARRAQWKRDEVAAVLAIAARFREDMACPAGSSDHSWMYNEENGLPR